MAETEKYLNPREKARLEEEKKNRKTRNQYLLIGAVILLMILLVVFVNSSLFYDGLPALKVGDAKYTVADVNYEAQKGYMQFTQSYGSYLSMFLDTSKPLKDQDCMLDPDGGSWADYFKKMAETNLVQQTAALAAAKAAGYELTEEDQAQIDNVISTYAMYGAYYGYSDADGYLAATYGAGNNEKTVRRHMADEILVDRYLNDLYDGFTFSDEEKDAYYDEHADSMDKINCLYSYITGDDAEIKASDIMDAVEQGNEDSFRAAVLDVTGSEASQTSYSRTGFIGQYGESIAADEIVPGKAFSHYTESGFYTVFILGVDDNHYNTVSVRHILIKAVDADGDGAYSDEEKAAALEKIQEIEKEWLAGVATEDSFAELAGLYSEDDGSKNNGGLYENIYKGQMVSEFNDFCFAGHSSGDTGIVYGESGSYAGYHLIYFVNADGELYSRTMAEEELRSQSYNEAVTALTGDLKPERTFMWRYAMNS